MSTRLLRKLKKTDQSSEVDKLKNIDLNENLREDEAEEGEENGENNQSSGTYVFVNKFDLLENEDNELDDDKDNDQDTDTNNVNSTKTQKAKKKSKSKKSNKKESKTSASNDDFKFVSNDDLEKQESEKANDEFDCEDLISNRNENKINRSLLQIENKHLSCEYEMIRMFGAKVVNAEKSNQQRIANNNNKRVVLNKLSKYNSIVSKKSTWPEFKKNGLQMKLLTSNASSAAALNSLNPNELEFTFEHLKDYQQIQFNFLDAVESLDHNNIMLVLHIYPYHVDSLIQLSDISRINDDSAMAADLIERAIYAFQCSFNPQFNLQKNNFRLDYCRVENRGFYICLFKHLLYIGAKACYRTSLELCKLLLSLDINNDPLGAILMIDFYALRSQQYKYFIEFYNYFDAIKCLNLLPNMQYSLSLAYFNLYKDTNNLNNLKEADKLLKEALIKFPAMLLQLLDKCNVMPDKDVENSRIFARHANLNIPDGLRYLYDLYSIRMNCEWKIGEVITWLEKNVKEIVINEEIHLKQVKEYQSKFKTLFKFAPANLLRHIVLCDSKEMALTLPPEFAANPMYTFDPIPPNNSIVSYTRPERPRTIATYANETSLLTFFRSLLPSFNSQERVAETEAANALPTRQAMANQIGNIANQLREFLFNLQPPNNEANDNDANNDNDAQNNNDDIHEFD